MKVFEVTVTVPADAASCWQVWTDVNQWSHWDPHEEAATMTEPFVGGATGWAKPKGAPAGEFVLLEVVDGQRWTSRSALPGGGLTFTHEVHQVVGGARLTLSAQVSGPLTPLILAVWARRMRRDAPQTLEALGVEAGRWAILQQ